MPTHARYALSFIAGSGLRVIAAFNPLTYLVNALRGAMIVGGKNAYAGSTSFDVMLLVFAVLLASASQTLSGAGAIRREQAEVSQARIHAPC